MAQGTIHTLFTFAFLTEARRRAIIGNVKNFVSIFMLRFKGDEPYLMNLIRRLMYGRYGSDQLSLFLLAVYLLLYLISVILDWYILSWAALAVLAWDVYRMMSRRIDRRRAENARFLQLIGPAARWFKLRRAIHRDKEHRYFKCPNCGQYLRVPRGKGKITVTCRNCGASFEEKS